jgi:pimeloyl-ACP methyl ester carboxylesterase
MTLSKPAWLDSMYNNRMLVPAFAQHMAQWQADSAQARLSLPCELDVAYGVEPGETLDFFPAKRRGSPVVVFIHGGYWRALDKADHSFVAPALHAAGAAVVVPNYALCPAVTIPQITLQMVRALAWTWRHAERLNADPSRITVIGHSAGGHLAAMMMACHWPAFDADLPAQLVKNASAAGITAPILARIPNTPVSAPDALRFWSEFSKIRPPNALGAVAAPVAIGLSPLRRRQAPSSPENQTLPVSIGRQRKSPTPLPATPGNGSVLQAMGRTGRLGPRRKPMQRQSIPSPKHTTAITPSATAAW